MISISVGLQKWGNPFEIGKDGDRDEVCDKYEEWFFKQENLISDLHELKDKTLGCFCAPKKCHGDFLKQCAIIYTAYILCKPISPNLTFKQFYYMTNHVFNIEKDKQNQKVTK